MKQNIHLPGLPKKPEPSKLVTIAAGLSHPNVIKTGVTTTEKGDWALLVTTKKNASTPIKEVEKKSEGFPVIYQKDSGRSQVARPAYPEMGE